MYEENFIFQHLLVTNKLSATAEKEFVCPNYILFFISDTDDGEGGGGVGLALQLFCSRKMLRGTGTVNFFLSARFCNDREK